MANPLFSKIGNKTVTPIETDLDGWKKVEGHPTMKTWIEYTSDDKSMISGWWEATPGTYHASYESWEFVHLIEGQITIRQMEVLRSRSAPEMRSWLKRASREPGKSSKRHSSILLLNCNSGPSAREAGIRFRGYAEHSIFEASCRVPDHAEF